MKNMTQLEQLASSQKHTRQLLLQAQTSMNAKDLEVSLNTIEQARTNAPSCMADQIQKMIDQVNTMLTNFQNATNRAASASNACDFDAALQAAQEAQSISPQHSWVRENVTKIQNLASKKQQARMLIQQAVTQSQSATTPDHWDAVIETLEQARSNAPSCLLGEIDSLIAAAREKKLMKPRVEKSIVLLIDTSGSMADNNKIANAKLAAGQAVRKLGPSTEVAILAFSGDCSNPVRIAHQFSNDSNSLIQAIESLSPGGGTPMAPALGVASQYMQQNGRGKSGEIILMCDGQNDCGSVQDASNGVRTSSIPTTVSTIGFDIPQGSQADQDLQSIASQTGGRNYSASNSKELIHAFSRALLLNAIKRDDPSFSMPAVGLKVKSLFDSAQSSLQRNDFSGALTQYKQAYDLAPSSPGVNYNLSIVYEELDQLTPSVNHAEKYLALAPNAFDSGDVQARISSMKKELATNPREILDPTGCQDLYFWAKTQDQKKVKDPVQKALLFEILISAQKGDCTKARDSHDRYLKLGR
jgi:Mg-chelatase subunit ChlD